MAGEEEILAWTQTMGHVGWIVMATESPGDL
jgi:hypothetical protein